MSTSNGKPRRQFPAEMKWQTSQEARQGRMPISQVCEKYGLRPSQVYQGESLAEQAVLDAFGRQKRGRKTRRPSEEQLVAEIERLRAVIAELSAENLPLKKGRWRERQGGDTQ
jgi:transposase-like protein